MKINAWCFLFLAVIKNADATAGKDQPNGVAKVLAEVEQKWLKLSLAKGQCDSASNTKSPCATKVTSEFSTSCSTVSTAIMNTAGGDKSKMESYMAGVCGTGMFEGQLKDLCLDYSQVLSKQMTEHIVGANDMRGVNMSKLCLDLFHEGYLGRVAAAEAKNLRDTRATMVAREQRKASEEHRTKSEEAAAGAKVQKEAEAKAALAQKRLEELANATAAANKKHEEAVAAAIEAQQKALQVEKAEEVKKSLQEKADKAASEARAIKANLNNMTAELENVMLQHEKAAKEARAARESLQNVHVNFANSTKSVNVSVGANMTDSINKTKRIGKAFLATSSRVSYLQTSPVVVDHPAVPPAAVPVKNANPPSGPVVKR